MIDRLLRIVAPHDCVSCGREGALLCSVCRAKVQPALARCYRCNAVANGWRTCSSCRSSSALYQVRAVAKYDGTVKNLIWKLKFARAKAAAAEIAELLAPALPGGSEYFITPVPTAQTRIRQRGYDQSVLIARNLAGLAPNAIYNPVLRRTNNVRQLGQTRIHRFEQLKQAFRSDTLADRPHIILIDDVVTTGATLESAASVLRLAGAGTVEALVLAQA